MADRETGRVAEAVIAEVTRLEMGDSVAGQTAIVLAQSMDASGEGAAGVASAARALERWMTRVRDEAKPRQVDGLDEIAQKRAARQAKAAAPKRAPRRRKAKASE